ncbi:MAG TPA: RidA family protein [Chitinophagaceae bacterium]|nr:RidA family protein [Chitinophagaceae bacterium]
MPHTILNTSQAPAPIGPYSQAVRAGNTLYVSGQICLDPATGELRNGSIREETRQVMENLRAILQEAGMDFSRVVKCTLFITDMKQFAEINDVYGQYFTGHYPARETVQVAALPRFVQVEISLIAVA